MNCTFTPSSITFTSSDTGYHNSYTGPAVITCTPATYTIGGAVSGLPTGASVTVSDTDNGDNVVVSANGSFTLPAALGNGAAYAVTATASSSAFGCTVSSGSGSINSSNVANVAVNCSAVAGVTSIPLSGQNGLLFLAPNYLFVANYGGANGGQVLVYTEQLDSASHRVTGLTLVASITQGISGPTRLAADSNNHLYVANTSSNAVTVYDVSSQSSIAANTIPQITADTISTGITHPLGVAVDNAGNVYVANNSANSISIFQPASTGGFTQVGSALTTDGTGNAFSAPGVLAFFQVPGAGNYLLVGLGPSVGADSVLLYSTPLAATSRPIYALSNSNCSTGPSGPTGLALLSSGSPQLYVASFYSSSVVSYGVSSFLSGGSSCTAPSFTSGAASQVSQPEGLAVDGFGNVFVSNANTSSITAYSPGSGLGSAPVYTQH